MRKIIETAVRERKVTILIFLILMIIGSYNYFIIPKQEFPDASWPVGIITTIYPGATSEDVEVLISKKIEDEMDSVKGMKTIRSISAKSVSTVILEFEYLKDQSRTFSEIYQKLDDLESELPNNALKPSFNHELTESAGIIISFSGGKYTYDQLSEFADEYKDNLVKINGIKRIDINGDIKRRVAVTIDYNKLNQFSLSVMDIYNILQAQNVQIPPGSLETESGKINVSTTGRFENIRDIENIILLVSPQNGSILRLKDIASVEVENESDIQKYRNNSKDAVLLSVYFKKDKNIVTVGKKIRRVINDINLNLPEDLNVDEILYQPQVVDDSLANFSTSLFQGMIFVIIVVFLGMGIRNAIIVSTAIPLTILVTFSVMALLKIELQQMSTSALIIALGILVDNSIVISDAIQIKINEGLDHFNASVEGAKESSIPVLTATLTTVASFMPLLYLSGFVGEFAYSLPMVVIIALILSYLVAMVFIPAMSSNFFVINNNQKLNRIKKLKTLFNAMLEISLNNKGGLLLAVGVSILFTSVLVFNMDIQLFPYADKDQLYLDINNELMGDLESTDEIVAEIEKILESESEIISYTCSIGGPLPKFYMVIPFYYAREDFAQLLIHLDFGQSDRFNDKETYAYYLQDKFDRSIIAGKVNVNILELSEPKPDIEIRIQGDDIDRLIEVGSDILEATSDMVELVNVMDTIPTTKYEYLVDVNKEYSSVIGITQYDIEQQINLAVSGMNASIMRREGNELPIFLVSNIHSKENLENLMIKSSFVDNKYLLKQLANIDIVSKRNFISRYQREAIVEVTANVRPEYKTNEVQSKIETLIAELVDDSDVTIIYSGEKEFLAEHLTSLGIAGIVALALVYFILLVQFNSFVQPFVILISAPLAILGSVWGLYITGMSITFTVLLGVISLFGIVVNNGILLIESINNERDEGHDIKSACKESINKRFNPIILSSATTIMGLVPLALSGSSFFAPMAVALMSGLIVATVLTMVVIPTVYSMLVK